MAMLSKTKIDEIEKEFLTLSKSLNLENEEETLRGGPMDSYKESAAFSVSKQAKESRVQELKNILKNIQVLSDYVDGKEIVTGKWFILKNRFGVKRYRLVDPIEADPSKDLISSESPLGKAIYLKCTNDNIQFNNDKLSIVHIQELYDIRNLNLCIFLRAMPVPRATALKGSSAT